MAAEYQLTPADYLSIMRQRAPYLIGIFAIGIVITLLVVVFIPRTYQSSGTIMIESQNVPANLIPSQLQQGVDVRINNIEQRILTRESLLRIANKYNLFKGSLRFLSSTELVQRMRDRVSVNLINIDTIQGFRRGKTTIAFSVAFEDKNPKIAYLVAKDIVGLFLNWNVKLQTEGATETTLFLAQAADKQAQEVKRLNNQISAYKKQHGDALPELVALHMSMMQNDEAELNRLDQQYEKLQTAMAGGNTQNTQAPTTLAGLKAELARLSLTYNDSYPDIVKLKLRIAAMEKSGGASASASGSGKAGTQGAGGDTLESIEKKRKKLRARIAQNQASIMQAPAVAQNLDVLISERDSAQKKYEQILGQQQNAQLAEKLKRENKGEHFVLLEPPAMPDKPFKPNIPKLVVMGFFLSIASAGGMLMAMAAMDKHIRGASALEQVVGSTPLAVVPYIVLPEEEVAKKRKIIMLIIVGIVGLIAIALFLQFFYMPLNDLFWKVLAKLLA